MRKWVDDDITRIILDAGADPTEAGWATALVAVCLVAVGILIGGAW